MTIAGAYVSLDQLLALSGPLKGSRRQKRGLSRQSGEFLARTRGQGIDLDEIRLYQAGDDVRSIDWKVTARKQKPHTKIFREERERPTLVVLDQTSTMFFGSKVRLKSVAATEIAARVAWQTLALRDRVGGIVLRDNRIDVVKPYRSGRNVAKFLRYATDANNSLSISRIHPEEAAQETWDLLPLQLKRIARVNHRIFLISDFCTPTLKIIQQIFALQRHNQMEVTLVFDELERTLPPANTYNVTDGRTRISFDSFNLRNRDQYRHRFDNRVEEIRTECRKMGIPFHLLNTQESVAGVGFSG